MVEFSFNLSKKGKFMREYGLEVSKSSLEQEEQVRKLAPGSIVKFQRTLQPENDATAMILINRIIPKLPPGCSFVIDNNLSPELAQAIGKVLPKETGLKVVFPLSPLVAIPAISQLGKSHTLWISIDKDSQGLGTISDKPIAMMIKAGQASFKVQLPAYLEGPALLAAIKAIPRLGTLKLPADISFDSAVKWLQALQPGRILAFPSSLPRDFCEKLLPFLPAGRCLEVSLSTKYAKSLIAKLNKDCYVKFTKTLSQQLTESGRLDLLQGKQDWDQCSLTAKSAKLQPTPFWEYKTEYLPPLEIVSERSHKPGF